MNNRKILVVDDQEMMRTMLLSILSKIGFDNNDQATNGEEALEMIKASVQQKQLYDLIFLDVVMPKMDGLRVLVECKSYDDTKNIPVIMVSSENEREIVAQAIMSGAAAYVIKPYGQKSVIEKVEQLLGTNRVDRTRPQ